MSGARTWSKGLLHLHERRKARNYSWPGETHCAKATIRQPSGSCGSEKGEKTRLIPETQERQALAGYIGARVTAKQARAKTGVTRAVSAAPHYSVPRGLPKYLPEGRCRIVITAAGNQSQSAGPRSSLHLSVNAWPICCRAQTPPKAVRTARAAELVTSDDMPLGARPASHRLFAARYRPRRKMRGQRPDGLQVIRVAVA